MGLVPGTKVILKGSEETGFGEVVADLRDENRVEVRFFTSPVSGQSLKVAASSVCRAILPEQTRSFHVVDGLTRYGRVLLLKEDTQPLRTYLVQLAGESHPVALPENEFAVRSYLPADDPLQVLAALANETPFFFENRANFLRELLRQNQLAQGLPALLSSKIDLLPHQVQISSLALRDPVIRYLLADEVGLGKTIEAGIILRQLQLDAPGIKMASFVPDQLVRQWRDELDDRFDLTDVEVFGHSELSAQAKLRTKWDIVVIDEAHRVVADAGTKKSPLAIAAAKISRDTQHLLLLSATPLLHHDSELLALLELLDPENYSSTDLAAFRTRTERRVLLGRAFLALRNSIATPLIKLNARKLAELLPDDTVVQQCAGELLLPDTDVKAIHRSLHLHISETYRIHRRLLRTRRRWLTESDRQYVRNVEERVEMEIDEERHTQLWQKLDEWRIETAARVSDSSSDILICAAEYIRLAEAIAAEPERLADLAEEVMTLTKATEAERRLLDDLVDPVSADRMTIARAELVCEILRNRFRKDGASAKYVVFCASPESCRAIVKRLKQHVQHSWISVADQTTSGEKVGSIFSDFAHNESRVLVTDSTGEEGFNLQFARAVIFHDLPWSPMRIEQRLGRLDRIERVGRITCFSITSGEDETLCLDEVWRRVLVDGFGIFCQSVSDLQHVIDVEIPRLQKRAFLGGPEALASEIESLKLQVVEERETIEEQDVIDGMHGLSPDFPLCSNLAQADREVEMFGDALTAYLGQNAGLRKRLNEEDNSLSFSLPRNTSPIIPSDRLDYLAEMLNQPATFFRNVAAESFSLQFLRPGHPAVDACRHLLAWDDRGRVFAMWREATEMSHVKCIFRCVVHVGVDISPVIEMLDSAEWDALQRGGLLRMVRGWFPDSLNDLFLDEEGKVVSEPIIELCRRPYDNRTDVNLGKERAAHVRDEFGSETWQKWCSSAADAALRSVAVSNDLRQKQDTALSESAEHFALTRTRLAARQRAGIETSAQTERSLQQEKDLEELVTKMLSTPVIRLDTIGAYLLSANKFWEKEE